MDRTTAVKAVREAIEAGLTTLSAELERVGIQRDADVDPEATLDDLALVARALALVGLAEHPALDALAAIVGERRRAVVAAALAEVGS